jgi:hypothetical protein
MSEFLQIIITQIEMTCRNNHIKNIYRNVMNETHNKIINNISHIMDKVFVNDYYYLLNLYYVSIDVCYLCIDTFIIKSNLR